MITLQPLPRVTDLAKHLAGKQGDQLLRTYKDRLAHFRHDARRHIDQGVSQDDYQTLILRIEAIDASARILDTVHATLRNSQQ